MWLQAPNKRGGSFVVGEKPFPLQYQFQDSDGVGLALSGYTAKFVLREENSATATEFSATWADATTGIAEYVWDGTEWPGPGHYLGEIWAGNGVQLFCSELLTFPVRAAVGTVPTI